MSSAPVAPVRRPFRFGLRALLVTVSVLAILLALWVRNAREQSSGLGALRLAFPDYGDDPPAYYDYQIVEIPVRPVFKYPFNDAGIDVNYDAAPTAPAWLVRSLGVNFFHSIVAVELPDITKEHDLFAAVARFRSLQHLRIEAQFHEVDGITCEFGPTDLDIAKLAALGQLKSLAISNATELTDDALGTIGRLRRLEMLTLWGGQFSDAGLAHLRRLHELEVLLIAERSTYEPTKFTDDGVARLADLVNLEHLHVDSQLLTGASLAHLSRMQKLTWLTMDSPKFVDDDLRFLAPLESLEWIEFVGTQLNGSGFRHLIGHPRLRSLSLGGTQLDDEGLTQIARLAGLEWLNICGTRVTAEGLAKLKACSRLKTLVISPDVPGDIPKLRQTLAPCEITVNTRGSAIF